MKQTTNSYVVMVPPHGFAFNYQTANTNSFQTATEITDVADQAMTEFNQMVATLKEQGIKVLILEQKSNLPDAVFPNNWFSTHVTASGLKTLIIYPMLTENRQAEVNITGLVELLESSTLCYPNLVDLRGSHKEILEGTGSLVLDKDNQVIYASRSSRTSDALVIKVATLLGYDSILFDSFDNNNNPIYHTNVIMGIARDYVIICLESIQDLTQRNHVLDSLKRSKKEIIAISLEQVTHMCGNVLELYNDKHQSLLVLSSQAKQYFTAEQLKQIQKHSILIPVHIPTIETIGGGSARCMLAEIDF